MTSVTVALAQLLPNSDPQANLARGLAVCREAAAAGADIVLFPEMWQLGYAKKPVDPEERDTWLDQAIDLDDPWLEEFRAVARELGIAVAVTFLQRWPGAPRNAGTIIDRHGHSVLTYAKVHTCDWWWERVFTPGDGFDVATVDTAAGPVDVGMMICFDREFPESARELMLGGAELILVPNACELGGDRVNQLRTRAFENMTAVATANYAAPVYDGHSSLFDGVAYAHGRPRNHLVTQAGTDEAIAYAKVDLDLLRAYRDRQIWGAAYRKEHAYSTRSRARLSPTTFARTDARDAPPQLTRSALVVPVPNAKAAARRHRELWDPAGVAGVPEHVTLLYPFVPPEVIDADVLARVADVVGRAEPFDLQLTDVRSFGDRVLWLAPEPAEPFVALTEALVEEFGILPYEGAYDGITPHLTVAYEPTDPAQVERELREHLPIADRAGVVQLLVGGEESGWGLRDVFELGARRFRRQLSA